MAKMYCIHSIQLHAEVKAEDFERFAIEKLSKAPIYEGWKVSLLKGEKGDREGQYLVLFEVESVEARNRVISQQGIFTEYAQQFLKEHAPFFETFSQEWAKYSPTFPGKNTIFTDYVVMGD
jgi:hypothetical protein